MADLQKTIQIVFDAVDKSGNAFDSIGGGVGKITGAVQDVLGPFAEFNEALLKAETAAFMVGAAFVGLAIKDALTLEGALADLNKVLGENDGAAKDYLPTIKEVALQFGKSAAEVAVLAAQWKEAGYTAAEVFGENGNVSLIEASLHAATAAGMSNEDVTTKLIQIMKGFGLEAGEVYKAMDPLNALSNESGTSFEQLGEALGRSASAARSAGADLNLAAAMLAVLVEQTQRAEISGTAFNSIMTQLTVKAQDVAGVIEKVTGSTHGYNETSKTATEILTELARIYPNLTEEQKTLISAQLVGTEQSGKLNIVLREWETVLKNLETANNSAGSAMEESRIRMEATAFAVDQAKASYVLLSESIGMQFLDSTRKSAEATTSLFTAMEKLVSESKALSPILQPLNSLLEWFAAGVQEIAKNLPAVMAEIDWTKWEGGITNLTAAFQKLFSGIDLTTPEGLKAAIQAIVDTGAGLMQYTSGAIEGLKPLADVIAEVVKWFIGLEPETQKAIGYFGGFSTTATTLAGAVAPLEGIFSGLSNILQIVVAIGIAQWATGGAAAIGAAGAAGTLTGAAGAAAVALGAIGGAYAAWQVSNWLISYDQLQRANEDLKGETERLDEQAKKLPATFKEISDRTGVVVTTMEEFNDAVNEGRLVFDEVAGQWVKAGDALEKIGPAAKTAAASLDGYSKEAYQSSRDTFELEKQMMSLASNERIKAMEFKMTLDIATVEANTETVKSAFESMNVVIKSTGDLLGTLFGLLGDENMSAWDRQLIRAQIEKENELRYQQMELQKEMIEAQIEYMRLRNDALARDQAMITIDGSGLQPHLEAFMWEVLAAIQVRTNQEGLEMLVGL